MYNLEEIKYDFTLIQIANHCILCYSAYKDIKRLNRNIYIAMCQSFVPKI